MKVYKNDQITVYWYPELCAHPGICLQMLPRVFNLKQRPWVNVDAAEPEEIVRVINECPSGALRYSLPEDSIIDGNVINGVGNINNDKTSSAAVKIKVTANGPLLIEGPTVVIGFDGKTLNEGSRFALCRCGLSQNRPYCDGVHSKQGWKPDHITSGDKVNQDEEGI